MAMVDTINALHAATDTDGDNMRKCAECGRHFQGRRSHGRFCPAIGGKASGCAKAWNNRNTSRGGPVVPLLQAWAMTRHAKPGTREAEINRYARREITDIARIFNDDDSLKGRASVLDYVGQLMDTQSMYVDRVRL